MGHGHSTETESRRASLVPQDFMFSESDPEPDCDWEIYHIEIELKSLPSYIRDDTHICIDEYTQEILSGEEVCRCACASRSEGEEMCSGGESDEVTICEYLHSNSDGDFCIQWDMSKEDLFQMDNEEHTAKDMSEAYCHLQEKAAHDMGRMCVQDCNHFEKPDNISIPETSTPEDRKKKSVLMSQPQSQTESTSLPNHNGFKKDLVTPQSSMRISSLNVEKRHLPACSATSPHIWTDRRHSAAILDNRPATIVSTADTFKNQPADCGKGARPRRKSCSIPIPQARTPSLPLKHSLDSKKRKHSLKDDPGWIPNPLDSDSDNSDFEDSGIFSDCSPGISTSPGTPKNKSCARTLRISKSPDSQAISTSKSDAKAHALSTGRRRYYSEPASDSSMSSNNSTQVEKSPARRGSRWRLLGLSWKVSNNTPKNDNPAQAEISHQDEEDLSEHLRWLTMSDSQVSEETQSSSEHGEDISSSDVPNTTPTTDVRDSQSSGEASSQPVGRFDDELELDWLCEPEWNNLELELFWSVLRPHLEHLLQPEDSELLPEPCQAVCHSDAADPKMLDRCLFHVQWHIWKGSYSQAVADFRAIRRHFLCCAQSQLIECGTRDDVENLRLIFQRKRPSRFRLWI